MKKIKKSSYFFAAFFTALIILMAAPFVSTVTQPASADHTALTLTPRTAREQKDLIMAEQREERSETTGPLIAVMSVTDAQARVLNLNHASKNAGNQHNF